MYDKKQAQSNISKIKSEIENLKTNHCEVGAFGVVKYYRYNDFWTHAKKITGMFKELKPLPREDREKLWQTYEKACKNMKKIQNEGREQSNLNRKNIESKIKDAYSTAGGSDNAFGVYADKKMLDRAKSMQTETLNLMKGSTLIKKDRDACWQYWKEVNKGIGAKREQTQKINYVRVDAEVGNARDAAHSEDPYDALKKIKAVQKIMKDTYLHKDRRNELRIRLNEAWQEASSRIDEKKEEKRRKYEDWQNRMEGNISRWETNIEKSEAFISRLEDQVDDLESNVRNAWSDDYAQRATGWIAEKYVKIREVRGQISDLEAKISDVKSKLKD